MSDLIVNPFASPVFDPIVQPGADYVETSFGYPFNIVLAANTTYTNQVVSIDRESDFVLYGIQVVNVTSPLGALQIMDNQGLLLQADYVNFGAFLVGGLSVPYSVTPGRVFAAGGRILINIKDTSGAQNTVQLLFRGVKRTSLQSLKSRNMNRAAAA